MSKIFKPRRGLASTMSGTKASTVLASGELFIECPNAGVGKGYSNIKIGDGTTAYSSLPYALEGDTSAFKVTVTADTSADYDTAMGNIVSNKSVGGLVGSIKQAISKLKADVTSLNTAMDGRVTDLEDAVTTLNSKTQEMSTKLTTLENGIKNLSGSATIRNNSPQMWVYYTKYFCIVHIDTGGAEYKSGETSLGTMPEAYRPANFIVVSFGGHVSSGGTVCAGYCKIWPDGSTAARYTTIVAGTQMYIRKNPG